MTNGCQRLEFARIWVEKRRVMITGPHPRRSWRLSPPVLGLALAVLGAGAAGGQTAPNASALQAPTGSVPQLLPPLQSPAPAGRGSPPPTAQMPLTLPPSLPSPVAPNARPGEGTVQAVARFGRDGAVITGGLHWRIYSDRPDPAGGFRQIKEDRSAQPTFVLPAGRYIVHVAFRACEHGKACAGAE